MRILTALLLLPSLCFGAATVSRPVFLNATEIDAINVLVGNSDQPWLNAYNAMIADANAALNQSVIGVTSQGSSSHDYFTQKPYDWSNNLPSPCGSTTCDGQINPQADRGDYTAAIDVCNAVRDLGLAYAFTGTSSYADKAIDLINGWCVDAGTYMTPSLDESSNNYIELYITMPAMFYGASLIYDYGGWDSGERADFLTWVSDFLLTAEPSPTGHGQNWESWREVMVAAGAAITNDTTKLSTIWAKFQQIMPLQIGNPGTMVRELDRNTSFHYSTYALSAMTLVAEIGEHYGQDLYGYTVGTDNLQKAWDYHAPYILNPSSWSAGQQINPYSYEGVGLYELAYAEVQDADYLAVINDRGRPMDEIRVLGHPTLTHSFRTGFEGGGQQVQVTMSPNGGQFTGSQEITLTSTDADAIYYTLDNTTPTAGSTLYSAPFTITDTTIVKAFAVQDGFDDSGVTTRTFTELLGQGGDLDTVAGGWQNGATGRTDTGAFTVAFNVVLRADSIDAVVGLSDGTADAFSDLACILRFYTNGLVDCRDGGAYASVTSPQYEANVGIPVMMLVDVSAKTYSAKVRIGSFWKNIAVDYDFRTEQASVTQLTHVSAFTNSTGSHTVTNVRFMAPEQYTATGSFY